jgi:hypothetical protein
VRPGYDALLVDQSLTLNRRRKNVEYIHDDEEEGQDEQTDQNYHQVNNNYETPYLEGDTIPKIYACATMWHEIKVRRMVSVLPDREFQFQCISNLFTISGRNGGNVEERLSYGRRSVRATNCAEVL